MRIITPSKIDTYSRCPKRCFFSWNSKPQIDLEIEVLQDMIKKLYLFHARTGTLKPWRGMPHRTHQMLLEYVKDSDKVSEYKKVKNILYKLSVWYNGPYLNEYCDEGIINMPIRIGLGYSCIYKDSVDIVTIGKKLRLFDFKQVRDNEEYAAYNGRKIYNSLEVQSRIWGFWKSSEVLPEEYVRLVVGPIGLKPVRIKITEENIKKIDSSIVHIADGIKDNIFYPSFSKQCLSCPFAQHCSL